MNWKQFHFAAAGTKRLIAGNVQLAKAILAAAAEATTISVRGHPGNRHHFLK